MPTASPTRRRILQAAAAAPLPAGPAAAQTTAPNIVFILEADWK